jgi:hypothetical protein
MRKAKALIALHNLAIRMFFSGFILFSVLLDYNQHKHPLTYSFYLDSFLILKKYGRGR